jgi:DNA-binding protein HU-beta
VPCRFSNNTKEEPVNKAELIEIVAKEADLSKAAAGNALDAVIAAVTKAVSKGDTVTLVGFGTFKSSKRAARVGRNPQTGKELKIAATTVPRFTAGAGFKAAVSGRRPQRKSNQLGSATSGARRRAGFPSPASDYTEDYRQRAFD